MRVAVIDPSSFSLPYDHCLCQALVGQGCDVVLVASRYLYGQWHHPGDYARWDHFYRWTDRLYRGRPSGLLRSPVKAVEHVIGMHSLVRRLRGWNPDVLHFQWLPVPVADQWFIPRIKDETKLILTVHDSQPFHRSPSSAMQLWGYERSLRLFDHLITHTHFARQRLTCAGTISPDRVSVIPHGVFDYYRTAYDSERRTTDAEAAQVRTILFFGIIKPYKGVDLLIRAFSRLPAPLQEKSVLRIAGYPKMDVRPLRELAARLGVAERIRWDLRFIPEDEVAAVFSQAAIVVLPYREIDGSGVLMTALAFGKPIVCTKIRGFTEMLGDQQACFVQPDDAADLAQALHRLLARPALARRMGREAAKLAQGDLSWSSIARKTMRLYRAV